MGFKPYTDTKAVAGQKERRREQLASAGYSPELPYGW